jgi:hypothetical protein
MRVRTAKEDLSTSQTTSTTTSDSPIEDALDDNIISQALDAPEGLAQRPGVPQFSRDLDPGLCNANEGASISICRTPTDREISPWNLCSLQKSLHRIEGV